MKKLALPLSLLLIAGTAMAQQATKAPAAAPKPAAKAASSHHVKGEIVSVSAENKTVTFKNAKGEELTWPAEGKAAASLTTWKAGAQVSVRYTVDEKGEPKAAISIAKASTHKPAAPKK